MSDVRLLSHFRRVFCSARKGVTAVVVPLSTSKRKIGAPFTLVWPRGLSQMPALMGIRCPRAKRVSLSTSNAPTASHTVEGAGTLSDNSTPLMANGEGTSENPENPVFYV